MLIVVGGGGRPSPPPWGPRNSTDDGKNPPATAEEQVHVERYSVAEAGGRRKEGRPCSWGMGDPYTYLPTYKSSRSSGGRTVE